MRQSPASDKGLSRRAFVLIVAGYPGQSGPGKLRDFPVFSEEGSSMKGLAFFAVRGRSLSRYSYRHLSITKERNRERL